MKPKDSLIEVDSKSGYLVRYEMTENRSWAASPLRFTVAASGRTIEEARVNAAKAIQLFLKDEKEHKRKVPDPESAPEERYMERERFDKAMGKILSVSKEDLDRRLEASKVFKTGKRYPKEVESERKVIK